VLASPSAGKLAKAGHVARGGPAEHASDHYPVVIGFSI